MAGEAGTVEDRQAWVRLREELTGAARAVGVQPAWGDRTLHLMHDEREIEVPLPAWLEAMQGLGEEERAGWLAAAIRRLVEAPSADELRTVQDQVRLRLWPDGREAEEGQIIAMPVMPGVRVAVCVDLPDSVVMVTPALLSRWGLQPGQAFALGMRNVLRETVEEEVLEGPLGAQIHVHSGPGLSVSARALALERWVKAPHGALVAVPDEHHLIFFPLDDHRAVVAMQAVWVLAQGAYRDAERPVSPDLMWWQPGRFTKIEVLRDPETDAVAVRPPAEFAAVIEALCADPEEGPST
jgi:hypothetical protein